LLCLGGGQASHVLHMLDTNQENNKANDVAAVFNTVEAMVARVVRCGAKLGDRSGEVAMELVKNNGLRTMIPTQKELN
jgi:hypothetical protein